MRKETYANKLAELLGIADKVEVPAKFKSKDKTNKKSKIAFDDVSEEDIQEFRQVQGIAYYLRAPELFHHHTCRNCKESFLVSRRFVGFCSYSCIQEDLAKSGIEWTKGKDLEALVMDPQVYNGQEPIWIRNLEQLERVLKHLTSVKQPV